ncbi:hypothetical protein AAVH_13844 [Aphelenchoides avenae]|nr:hypothetical protein AAVH_13844 [Aphelenchus avenae]
MYVSITREKGDVKAREMQSPVAAVNPHGCCQGNWENVATAVSGPKHTKPRDHMNKNLNLPSPGRRVLHGVFGPLRILSARATPTYCRVDVVSDAWFFYGLLGAKQIPDGDRASEPRRLRAYVKELFRTVNDIYRRNEVPVQFTVGDLMLVPYKECPKEQTPSICMMHANSSHPIRLLRDFSKIYEPKKNGCLMLYLTFRPLHQVQEDGRRQMSMGMSPVPHRRNKWDCGICTTGLFDNEEYKNIYKNYVLVSATDAERIPVIETLSAYDIAHGIAHELGHSLSALHDEDYHRPECVDGFLMTASGYKKSERRSANGDMFSPCAKQAVLSHLRRVEQTAKSHQDQWDEDWDEADAERQENMQRKVEL